METIWYCLVAVMIAIYVVLDGFDMGAGIVHLFVARTEGERRAVLASIGPVWDGNEVWLLAGGGTLYFAFPGLYASSFSGFYLPLMIVLWLLIFRGISIEFRNHIQSLVWQPFWDAVFAVASALLAIFFGAALGNVVRGAPLDRSGEFFLPLWTDFTAGKNTGILDWYTILIAVAALLTLAVHGSLWVALKTEGAVEGRARRFAKAVWWGLLVCSSDHARQLPHSAAFERAFCRAPVGLHFPTLGDRRPYRHSGSRWPSWRIRSVPVLVPVYPGDADQRGLRDLPVRAALERRSRAQSDRSQFGGTPLRSPGWADVVHPRHAPCRRILCLHLSQFLWQGESRRRGPLLRRPADEPAPLRLAALTPAARQARQ